MKKRKVPGTGIEILQSLEVIVIFYEPFYFNHGLSPPVMCAQMSVAGTPASLSALTVSSS